MLLGSFIVEAPKGGFSADGVVYTLVCNLVPMYSSGRREHLVHTSCLHMHKFYIPTLWEASISKGTL